MFNISDSGTITLTRGDSFSSPLYINQGTELSPVRYILTENDTVYFAIMEENKSFEDAIIKKVYNGSSEATLDGDIILKLKPQDTENLVCGKYIYTVKLKQTVSQDDYDVTTLIIEQPFYIT